jgi:hypothetical protein
MVGSTPRALRGGTRLRLAHTGTLARANMHARTHRDRKEKHARRPEEEDSACVGKQDPLLESPVMHADTQDQEQYVYVQTLMHIWVHVHLQRERARERASERDQQTHTQHMDQAQTKKC